MKIKISGLPKSPKLKIAGKCLSQKEEGSEFQRPRKPCSDANTKNACEYMNRCHTYNDQFIGNTARRQSSISKHPVVNNALSPSASLNAWSRSQTRNNDQKEEEEHEEIQTSEPYSMFDFNQTSGISIYEPDYYLEQQPRYNSEQPSYNSEQPSYNSKQPSYNSEQPSYTSDQPSYNSKQPSYNSKQPSNTSQYKNGRGNLETAFTTRTIPSIVLEKTNDKSDYSSSSNEISQDEFTRPKKSNGPRYELRKLNFVDDTPHKRPKTRSTLVSRAIQTLNRWGKGPAHGFEGALVEDTQDTTEPYWKADKGGAFNPYENDAEKEDTDQLVMNDKYLEGIDDIPYPNTSAHTSFDNLLLLDDGLDTSYEGGYNGDGINSGKPRRNSVSFRELNSKQSLNSETTSIKSKEHSKSSRKRKDTAYAIPVGGSRGFDSSRGTSSRDKSRDLSRVVPHREPLPSVTTMSDQNDEVLLQLRCKVLYLNKAANSTQQYPDCKSIACAEPTCSRCRFEPSTYAQYCGDRLQCKRACCRSCHDFDPYREDSSSYQGVYSSDSDEGSSSDENDYVCNDCSCAVEAKNTHELCSYSQTDECQDCCSECECDCLVCAAARELAEKLKNTKIRTVRINHND